MLQLDDIVVKSILHDFNAEVAVSQWAVLTPGHRANDKAHGRVTPQQDHWWMSLVQTCLQAIVPCKGSSDIDSSVLCTIHRFFISMSHVLTTVVDQWDTPLDQASLKSIDALTSTWSRCATEAMLLVFLRPLLQLAPFQDTSTSLLPNNDATCTATCPVRLRLAGGWSDTPPQCLEMAGGGRVLNMAVTPCPDDSNPVHATCTWESTISGNIGSSISSHCNDVDIDTYIDVTVVSRDTLGEGVCRLHIPHLDQLLDHQDPSAPFALHKAVLSLALYHHHLQQHHGTIVSYIGHQHPLCSLIDRCYRLRDLDQARVTVPRGRVTLTTRVHDVPHGSGLGTSSILILACIRAIAKACPWSLAGSIVRGGLDEQFIAVLCVEQMLTTGGGWQDQVGGGVGGIKLTHALPVASTRLPLNFNIDHIPLDTVHRQYLQQRLVCVFTGVTRLAKGRLVNISRQYALRDPGTLRSLRALVETAQEQYHTLMQFAQTPIAGGANAGASIATATPTCPDADRHLARLATLINQTRDLDTQLDQGHIPESAEHLCHVIMQEHCTGYDLVGSGAGGFMIGLLAPHSSREHLQRHLQRDAALLPRDCRLYGMQLVYDDKT